jgi:hypothetical protein
VAGHGGAARQHSDQVIAEPAAEERRRRSLGDVEQRDGQAELETERPPYIRRADVPAAERTHVDTGDEPGQPEPPRQRAEEIAGGDEEGVPQAWI